MSKVMKVSDKFYHDIEDVIKKRILNGKDPMLEPRTRTRITEGIPKHRLWETFKRDLITADMPMQKKERMNKKGLTALVGIFIGLTLFIILAFMFAVGSGVLMKVSNDLTSSVVNTATEDFNFKNTTINTAGQANVAVQQLRFFSWILIIALALGVLISAYMVKPSGITLFFWFLIGSGIFTASVFISRAYEDLYYSNGFIGDALHGTMAGTSWLIQYMPHIVVALIFIGGIIMYMRLKKQEDDLL